MSFNDLERGASSPRPQQGDVDTGALNGQSYSIGSGRGGRSQARGPLPLYHAPSSSLAHTPESDPAFKSLTNRIGIQIFKLNSNVQGIDKLVELQTRKIRTSQTQGHPNDKDWMTQIHELTEATRALVKDLGSAIKELASFPAEQLSPTDRLTASKLQREFEAAFNAFAKSQRESANLSRTLLDGAKEERERSLRAAKDANQTAVDETLVRIDEGQESGQQQQQQQTQKSAEPSLAEIEFQETLIAERESEIREIESGIHELNEIFRDLGHIVQEQGGMIDNIEYNVSTIATNTGSADRELVSANEYQRRAGRRAACLLLIVGFVIAVVLLAILS